MELLIQGGRILELCSVVESVMFKSSGMMANWKFSGLLCEESVGGLTPGKERDYEPEHVFHV